MRRGIFSADDFGLSIAVNEGIERAHRDGILSTASLMVAGAAAADAIRRARAMPGLRVGLHLVVIEGPAILPPAEIAGAGGPRGQFPTDQLGLGLALCLQPHRAAPARARRCRHSSAPSPPPACRSITPTPISICTCTRRSGDLLIEAGRGQRLRAMRIPAEPARLMALLGVPQGVGARALLGWTRLLRAQARRAGLVTNDQVFGIAWSGGMTEERLLRLIPRLPVGLSEIYFHPAAGRDAVLDRLMPGYDHEGEMAALLSPALRAAIGQAGIRPTTYAETGLILR